MKNAYKIKHHHSREIITAPSLIYEVIETLAMTTCAILLIFLFVCRVAVVDGDSMEHTLSDKDILIVSDVAFKPQYGDVVVFQRMDGHVMGDSLVKRVIATENQVINIDFETWTVTVDGVPLDERDYVYLASNKRVLSDFTYPLTVPEGHIFVMGDNRNNSLDSRDHKIGFVDARTVIGRVICRVAPIKDMKTYSRFN